MARFFTNDRASSAKGHKDLRLKSLHRPSVPSKDMPRTESFEFSVHLNYRQKDDQCHYGDKDQLIRTQPRRTTGKQDCQSSACNLHFEDSLPCIQYPVNEAFDSDFRGIFYAAGTPFVAEYTVPTKGRHTPWLGIEIDEKLRNYDCRAFRPTSDPTSPSRTRGVRYRRRRPTLCQAVRRKQTIR